MEGFRIDMKTFFGLAMPNQYCLLTGLEQCQNPVIFMISIIIQYYCTVLFLLVSRLKYFEIIFQGVLYSNTFARGITIFD